MIFDKQDREYLRIFGFWRWVYATFFYRRVMIIAHKFNWHHAPPCYPDGDTLLRCDWCGFSAVVRKRDYEPVIGIGNPTEKQESK